MDCAKTERCLNCHEYFEKLKPSVSEIIITKHFKKDAPDFDINLIVDCKHEYFAHLHKFEGKIDGNYVFRALKDKVHVVYVIDKKHRLIFLRAFSNFNEYQRFLEDKKRILEMLGKL